MVDIAFKKLISQLPKKSTELIQPNLLNIPCQTNLTYYLTNLTSLTSIGFDVKAT